MVFADDIAILADSRTALSKGINLIENWCKQNLMSLNKNKSQIIFVKSKPRSKKQKSGIPKKIQEIKVCEEAKYLGIIIDEKMNFQAQIDV